MTRLNGILAAWIISMVATLGSLYFSEIRGFIPCEWCWYQRILMYPLTILLGIAVYKRDTRIASYVLPFSITGIGVSTFHYLHQKTSWFDTAVQCSEGVPCSGEYINWLGFITIPFMALVAFTGITAVLVLSKRQ
jgi:disulfide bond formation protein DsbB